MFLLFKSPSSLLMYGSINCLLPAFSQSVVRFSLTSDFSSYRLSERSCFVVSCSSFSRSTSLSLEAKSRIDRREELFASSRAMCVCAGISCQENESVDVIYMPDERMRRSSSPKVSPLRSLFPDTHFTPDLLLLESWNASISSSPFPLTLLLHPDVLFRG